MATKKTQPRASSLDVVSPLRMSEMGLGNVTAATVGKIAPFLDARHPDCVEACGLYASLFYNAGGVRAIGASKVRRSSRSRTMPNSRTSRPRFAP